ncbi:hypothetical protein OCU04_009428 [Sclerotinia nivalis]|uniref:Uncharacterized protein n=1 Tax=Sclerotinia nivalis TaxID=352851 RepID=A0A9X0DFI0_9HELO|nr:hypothetical protein OCU04_009428 [Sclerotinia nivalis]
MPSWNFSGVDFNSMTELPTWAFSHLPLNEYAEFIPHVNMYDADDEGFNEDQLSRRIREIKEEEEPTHVVDSIQSWNYPAASTHLQSRIQQLKEEEREQKEQKEEEEERIRQELYSQARDSEQPNSLSECSDYPQVTYLQLHEPLPRTDDSQVFHRNTRAGLSSPIRQSTFTFTSDKEFEIKAKEKTPIISEAPRRKTRIGVSSLRLDQPPPIIDFSKIFPQNARNEVSPPMDIQAENKFPGFETMNFEKLIFDYEVAPLLHPTRPAEIYRCDIERPKHFSMEPHWFHDTEKKKCWCNHCIQYRETRSTGNQLEAHDFDKWCLCSRCMEIWHENLAEDEYCNCQNCVSTNKAQALEEEKEALAELDDALFAEIEKALAYFQNPLQLPEKPPNLEQRIPESSQKLPSDPLCEDPTKVVPESKEGSSNLFNTIRENLWLDSDS